MSSLKKIATFLALLVIFLASHWALLNFNDLYNTHDATHASRIAEMSRALQDGHFPVRWSENFAFGHGMPLFEFYAPLPFYVGSFFYCLGLNMSLTIKLLYLIAGLGSLLGTYKLSSRLFGRAAGLISTAAFLLAPYRALNIFVRGAISEAWGMMAMPWILWGIILLLSEKDKSKAWLYLVISLSVLFLSHNLSTLMFLPITVLFALFYMFKFKNFNWKKLAASYLLAIGLSAFYLFPAFLEKSFTKVQLILSDYFYYSNHFLYLRQFFVDNWGYGGSSWGPDDDISFFLGYGQWLGLIISIFVLAKIFVKEIFAAKNKLKTSKAFIFKHAFFISVEIITLLALLLTTHKSGWLWAALPLMSYIQFPWRWLSIASLFLALSIGYGLSQISSKFKRYLLSFGLLLLLLFNARYFHFYQNDGFHWEYACVDEKCIRERMSRILPDYAYINQKFDYQALALENLLSCDSDTKESKCQAKTDLIVDRGHEKLFVTDFDQDQKLTVHIAAFPGWRAELDGEIINLETGAAGDILLSVPTGKHKLAVYFASTQIRFLSDLLSATSFLILLYFLFVFDLKEE